MTTESVPATTPPRATLCGANLELCYDDRCVVRGATLDLQRGRVLALVGPNGSGKSTLLRSLARLHPASGGTVTLGDEDAFALTPKEFARRVTLLSQSRSTPGGVSVREVVAYGRHPYRGRWRNTDTEGDDVVTWAMSTTGVDAMAGRPVDELSGGERQRVWLASCLAQRTDVLLLDEPTTYLDLRYQVEILDIVRDLADAHDVAVGVVLHDLDQAAAVADDVALLASGRIVAHGAPGDVFTADALSTCYGIQVEVEVDHVSGRLRTRPVGRHTHRARPALATV
ncbi:ABC transporter related [Beutenbergia cavernae DSM 12333]|uniref:ABC transporter related n=1 Tax=Beutenbergia cavernae (strain ATCC BAA-8 / DSM 12333 / CCUG 43141 / JCM 11478 / NBRC 16432 / NCIMB 13614 / HKI 0122) TaxID=471853 RepID=C5BVF9_BEUC1|nr:ABC transporter ATP-binding protein [Beutenbergia cavernae]ACQ80546.1 ABC transporter related [Beutenbergia cavernae DSM 12333]